MARESRTPELSDLVVEAVDDARDVFRLAEQLSGYLPLESFDGLVKAVGDRRLQFRDAEFDVASLAGAIPEVAFPVLDERTLVRRLAELVRMVPPDLGLDLEGAEGSRRAGRVRSAAVTGMGTARRNAVGIAPHPPGPPASDDAPSPAADTDRSRS